MLHQKHGKPLSKWLECTEKNPKKKDVPIKPVMTHPTKSVIWYMLVTEVGSINLSLIFFCDTSTVQSFPLKPFFGKWTRVSKKSNLKK